MKRNCPYCGVNLKNSIRLRTEELIISEPSLEEETLKFQPVKHLRVRYFFCGSCGKILNLKKDEIIKILKQK